MSIEGQVTVKLLYADQRVEQVSVRSQRPLQIRNVVLGQAPQSAITLIGTLFQICGKAQSTAAVAAMEQSLNIQADTSNQWVRLQLLRMETLREHCWRIILDWPSLLHESADKQVMKQLLQICQQWQSIMDKNQRAFVIAAHLDYPDKTAGLTCLAELEQLLNHHLFAMPPEHWLQLDETPFTAWLTNQKTLPARVFNLLYEQQWTAIGQSKIHHLPELDPLQVQVLLSTDSAEQFIQQPEVAGNSYETTPLSRHQQHPLIQNLNKQAGNGLITRLTALLIDIAQMFTEMKDGLLKPVTDTVHHQSALDAHTGIGMVEAARGRLIHRVELEDGLIKNYQIVAPTEWNFHPRGALAKGLSSLLAETGDLLKQQAALLIQALDPCVRYSLEVNGHA